MLFLMMISAILELSVIGFVVPYVYIVSGENHYDFAKWIYLNNFDVIQGSLLYGGLIIISGVIRHISTSSTVKLAYDISAKISDSTFNNVLNSKYDEQKHKFIADEIRFNSMGVEELIVKIIIPVQYVIYSIITGSIILIGMVAYNSILALSVFGVMGIFYYAILLIVKNKLIANSMIQLKFSKNMVDIVHYSLMHFRDILINNEKSYLNVSYRELNRGLRSTQAYSEIVSVMPRFIIESFAILLFILLVSIYQNFEVNNEKMLADLLFVSMGALRLLPHFQRIYGGVASYFGHRDIIEEIDDRMIAFARNENLIDGGFNIEKIKTIRLECVRFTYDKRVIFDDFNFRIDAGSKTALIGKSGAGKSTLIDILLGLLSVESGKVLVNEFDINSINLVSYFQRISIVSQDVYIHGKTILDVIVGKTGALDEKRLRLIEDTVPLSDIGENYLENAIGENGSLLSGGQRQRISLAAALYKNSDLLILDEATSALDKSTESIIFNKIKENFKYLTILYITHSTELIEHADNVVNLDVNGCLNIKS